MLRVLQLGDMLCAVPALRALRAGAPDAHIALVALPWAAELAQRFHEYIDEFIEFPGYPGLPERPPQFDAIPAFIERMQARRFELALQLHGSGEITNPLTLLFGADVTAGFYAPDAYCPDESRFIHYPDDLPERLRLLRLVEFLGFEPIGDQLEFPLAPADRDELAGNGALASLPTNGYACLHPGARHPMRRWPPAKFAAAGDAIAERGVAVVITGTASERPMAAEVQRAMRAPAVNAAGLTSIGGLAALLSSSRLVVCNDTGVSHLADAVGAPSVVVFTGSDPERWAPGNGVRHRVLRGLGIEPAQVIDEVKRLLELEASHAA